MIHYSSMRRLFKLTVCKAFKTANSYFATVQLQGRFSSNVCYIGNLVRSYMITHSLWL